MESSLAKVKGWRFYREVASGHEPIVAKPFRGL